MRRKAPYALWTLLLVLVVAGCTELNHVPTAPSDNGSAASQSKVGQVQSVDRNLYGQALYTLWQVRERGVQLRASVNASAAGLAVVPPDVHLRSNRVGPTSFGIDLRPSDVGVPILYSSKAITMWDVLRASRPGRPLRVRLGGPTKTMSLPDGRTLRLELSPASKSGPSGATALYIGDKLTALTFMTYQRHGTSWKPSSMEVMHFGEDGGVSAVTTHDLTELERGPLPTPDAALEAFVAETQSLSDCESQVIPDPECAEDSCWREWLAVAKFSAAWLAAGLALDAAIALCPTPLAPLSCPAVAAAVGAVTLAAFELAEAHADLWACRNRGGGGGNPPNSGSNCATYIIEISYDGGVTWQYLDTVVICD